MNCDMCSAEPAAMMVTMVDTGDSFTVGGACAGAWALALAEQVGAVMDGKIVTAGEAAEPAGQEPAAEPDESTRTIATIIETGPRDDDDDQGETAEPAEPAAGQ